MLEAINFNYFSSPDRKATDETLEQMNKRMLAFVSFLVKKYPDQKIVVISHGDPIMTLKATINHLPLSIDSIRTGKNVAYIHHGEVLAVTATEDMQLTVKSIFIPRK
jgi:broad specificity phosphatase PhoE